MINRNNKYVSGDTKQIKASLGKKILVSVGGALITASLLTGCGKPVQDNLEAAAITQIQSEIYEYYQDMTDYDFLQYDDDTEIISIEGTNLEDATELSRFENATDLNLSSNLLTDISPLYGLHALTSLDISNNSIQSIDLSQYPNLESLYINGNYALYTQEIYDYCQQHNITLDITLEDIKCVEQLKEILASLNLDEKSELDAEKIVFNYVLEHMEYDHDALKDDTLAEEYNVNALQHALEGKGVCANYAVLFDALCDLQGINCFEINGLGKGEAHGWNLVEIDGTYMLCDATWSDQNDFLSEMIMTSRNYNATGSSAEKFNESHQETNIYRDEIDVQARSNMAETSDIENIISQDHTSLKARINQIISNIDLSQEDINKVLAGIAAGGVVLLSIKNQKKIKKALKQSKERKEKEKARKQAAKELKEELEAKEKEKKRKEELKKTENQKKPIQENNTKSEDTTKQILSQELTAKEEIVEEKKEPTIEEILNSLQTPEEKIAYLKQQANNTLRTAAEIQVDQESYLQIIKVYNKEEAINTAMQELVTLMDKSEDEKAIYRMNKDPDKDEDLTLEKLEEYRRVNNGAPNNTGKDLSTIKLTVESIPATGRIYNEVDQEMEKYKQILSMAEHVINKEVENMGAISVDSYESTI